MNSSTSSVFFMFNFILLSYTTVFSIYLKRRVIRLKVLKKRIQFEEVSRIQFEEVLKVTG